MQQFLRTSQFGYKEIETVTDYKNQLRLHTVRETMDVLKIPIDFKNPPVSKKLQ